MAEAKMGVEAATRRNTFLLAERDETTDCAESLLGEFARGKGTKQFVFGIKYFVFCLEVAGAS